MKLDSFVKNKPVTGKTSPVKTRRSKRKLRDNKAVRVRRNSGFFSMQEVHIEASCTTKKYAGAFGKSKQ